jgi:hypothetical protein
MRGCPGSASLHAAAAAPAATVSSSFLGLQQQKQQQQQQQEHARHFIFDLSMHLGMIITWGQDATAAA